MEGVMEGEEVLRAEEGMEVTLRRNLDLSRAVIMAVAGGEMEQGLDVEMYALPCCFCWRNSPHMAIT
jgi:hypothetical protein